MAFARRYRIKANQGWEGKDTYSVRRDNFNNFKRVATNRGLLKEGGSVNSPHARTIQIEDEPTAVSVVGCLGEWPGHCNPF
jgi:hypothetical protein